MTTGPDTVEIVGVPVHRVTMQEAIDRIVELVADGRRTGATHQVATVNVDFITNAVKDPALLQLLRRADLAIPDGMPLVWGSKLLDAPLAERVAGADLIPALAQRCATEQLTMYCFGSRDGISERAAGHLRERNPGLRIIGDSGRVMQTVRDITDAELAVIREAKPDIICVALGNPKQEWWIDAHRETLGIPVLIGVGGTFDLLVGEKRRAPAWIGTIGLEWVYRALQEPRRLIPRYARDIFVFMPRLGAQILHHRWARRRRAR